MRFWSFFAAFLLCASPLYGGGKRVTLYLDGSLVEQELAAADGYLELPLPASLIRGSLRVKPLDGGTVKRVEIVPAELDRRPATEIARLEKRRQLLQERLESIAVREDIFRAAAKSHASRAPKKAKNTPDPVAPLRLGAEYALGELDQLQRSRGRLSSELKGVEEEIRVARKGEPLLRVWLSGKMARISYLRSGESWAPSYDFRLKGDGGELLLHARLPKRERGVQYLVSPGPLEAAPPARRVDEEFPLLWRRPLSLERVSFREEPQPRLSFSFRQVQGGLPPGDASGYWNGEFLGSTSFSGASSGELSFGR